MKEKCDLTSEPMAEGISDENEKAVEQHAEVSAPAAESSGEVYRFLLGTELARYEVLFQSDPAACACGRHTFRFADRLAAALLLNVHNVNQVNAWISKHPSKVEYLDGILYCPSCKQFRMAKLRYPYPSDPDAPMPIEHPESEARLFDTVRER